MARTPKNQTLDSRTSRLANVKVGTRSWQKIGPGLSLGYRRPKEGSGSWNVRVLLDDGSEPWFPVGTADDYEDANEKKVLSYHQAMDAAKKIANEKRKPTHLQQGPITIAKVLELYLEAFADKGRKSLKETEYAINAHILPHLGSLEIANLEPKIIKAWQDKLARTPPRTASRRAGVHLSKDWKPTPENIRARQSSVNRIRTILIAALNHASDSGLIVDDTAWRKSKPFKAADKPIVQFLEPNDCVLLLNACSDDFRLVVRGALLTGARYGELTRVKVGDVQTSLGGVWLHETKSGHSRFVHLNSEGLKFFEGLCRDRDQNENAFQKSDGKPWGDSHQTRRFADALKKAGLPNRYSFHDLRHSYASMLIQAGVKLEAIADLLGHADTRITIRHYAHLSDKVRKEAVSRLPSFGIEESLESNVTRLKTIKKG